MKLADLKIPQLKNFSMGKAFKNEEWVQLKINYEAIKMKYKVLNVEKGLSMS